MQNLYFIDNTFVKENSASYILSIRYSTDGLSFCIHNPNDRLIAFFHQPYSLDTKDAVIAKAKKIIVDDELLNLKYKKVYVVPCSKEKILIPAHLFNKNYLPDMYRICIQPEKNDTLLYRKVRIMESYIAESLPRSFVNFLSSRYQSLCIINSAYPFIINSLLNMQSNTNNLFIDIQDQYFDILITNNSNILLFNSFSYGSVSDLIYYTLNCLKNCGVTKESLQTSISGNLVSDSKFLNTLSTYLPNITVLNAPGLTQTVKSNDLNNSAFVHLLSLHKCE